MKNQYFGDISDYLKFGLLRALQSTGLHRLLVAWMLTPDDNRKDGLFRFLKIISETWKHFDPELYTWLEQTLRSANTPAVELIEKTKLLPRTRFFSDLVPDKREPRYIWSDGLLDAAADMDLVFLDPDNGIEVPSRPIGRKDSSKYVAWNEIERLWKAGCSLLIYQHFPRVPREAFARRIAGEIKRRTAASVTYVFRTTRVLFILAGQSRHKKSLRDGVSCLRSRWGGNFVVSDMTAI